MINVFSIHLRHFGECKANWRPHTLFAGKLNPLAIPDNCRDVVLSYLVTKFQKRKNRNDAVIVLLNKLSKKAIFIHWKKTPRALEILPLFQDHFSQKLEFLLQSFSTAIRNLLQNIGPSCKISTLNSGCGAWGANPRSAAVSWKIRGECSGDETWPGRH